MAEPAVTTTSLGAALRDVIQHPVASLLGAWNWKAAAFSAMIRAGIFFATNLRAGHQKALQAMLVEATFAIFAAGVMAAFTQRLRNTQPLWATALVVWLGMPTAMVTAQYTVHHLSGTAHVRAGLIASFCFAGIASGFNWYAQRKGVMLSGDGEPSFAKDLRAIPGVILDFVLAGPKTVLRAMSSGR